MKTNAQKTSELPFVTIITSSYNQANYICETVDSILSQDYPNIEYLILDDSSTDGTPEKLAAYGDKIKWETLAEKTPQTPTINKGWRMTKGEIITWLNSDDTFYPGAITKIVEYFESHPETGIVFGDSMFTEADGTNLFSSEPMPDFSFRDYVLNCINVITQPSAFIRRDVIEKIGDLDESYNYIMDWDFWLRAGLSFKIEYVPELLSTYRLHPNSKSVAEAKNLAPEIEIMYKKFFANDLSQELRAIEKEAMMNMCFTSGGYYLEGNDTENAAKMATKAFKHNPSGIFSLQNLRKYIYCKFAGTNIYRQSKKVLKR